MSNLDGKPAAGQPIRWTRDRYPVLSEITTRWSDNDVYGHVNNVIYYSYFDTVVNRYLIEQRALDIHDGEVIGLVVQSQCDYFAPLAFPEPVAAGISIARLGNSSVHYRIGLFAAGRDEPAAEGRFVHVYVDRQTRRPVALPPRLREILLPLVESSSG